jgi:hypothetical protein
MVKKQRLRIQADPKAVAAFLTSNEDPRDHLQRDCVIQAWQPDRGNCSDLPSLRDGGGSPPRRHKKAAMMAVVADVRIVSVRPERGISLNPPYPLRKRASVMGSGCLPPILSRPIKAVSIPIGPERVQRAAGHGAAGYLRLLPGGAIGTLQTDECPLVPGTGFAHVSVCPGRQRPGSVDEQAVNCGRCFLRQAPACLAAIVLR